MRQLNNIVIERGRHSGVGIVEHANNQLMQTVKANYHPSSDVKNREGSCKSIQAQRLSPLKFRCTNEVPSGYEIFNAFEDEPVADENISVNYVPEFQSQFNFAEIKGHKQHPDDFNIYLHQEQNNEYRTQRLKSLNKLALLPKSIRESKQSTEFSPVST